MRLNFRFCALVVATGLLVSCVRSQVPESRWQQISVVPSVPIYALAKVPNKPQVLYVGTNDHGIYETTDGGNTWRSLGLLGQAVVGLAATSDDKVFVVTNYGLYQYDHGKWLILYLGPNKALGQPESLVASGNQLFAAGMRNGVYQFDIKAEQWVMVGANSWPKGLDASALVADSHGTLFAGTLDQGIYKYQGKTWRAFNQGFPALFLSNIGAFAFGPDGKLFVATNSAVYAYQNKTWQQLGAHSWPAHKIPHALYVDANHNVFAAMSRGGLYEYVAASKTWEKFSSSHLPNQSISVISDFNNKLYVGTGVGLYRYNP